MKRFIAYILIIGSVGYALANAGTNTIANGNSSRVALIDSL